MLRDNIAAVLRTLPRFRGKRRIGDFLADRYETAGDYLRTVRMRDGSLMRVDVRSRAERRAFWTGEYDLGMIFYLSSLLEPGCTVLDVGANVGFYAVALGRMLKPIGGTLHAFEPVPSNFARLQECATLNGLDGVIRAHHVALGNEEGTITLHMDTRGDASTGNAVMVKGKVADDPEMTANAESRLAPLDTFAEEVHINDCDLIKIDVEGAEVMFLEGASRFIERHRPVIYGEFSAYWMGQFGHSITDVSRLLSALGYRFYMESGAGFTEVTPEPGIENLLLRPTETVTHG